MCQPFVSKRRQTERELKVLLINPLPFSAALIMTLLCSLKNVAGSVPTFPINDKRARPSTDELYETIADGAICFNGNLLAIIEPDTFDNGTGLECNLWRLSKCPLKDSRTNV